ncbi:inositol monophosphatase family protein [Acidilobus sp.]|jgi:myo-inositol-1(or 4)-monophosphatase|uniref:inositol monophosphatase family protein n=1 Tax=Acidilobus sp. TaxID=1872109 RepID=UPI003D0313CF
MSKEVEDLRSLVVKIAEGAARMLREEWCTDSTKKVKGETIRADLESERAIFEDLKAQGLSFRMVSEESGVMGSGDYTFIVDPLDGSLNYENCIPWCSVSIAVIPPGSRSLSDAVAGAVAPIGFGNTISFGRGEGCFEGDERVSPATSESEIVFVYVERPEEAYRISRLFNYMPKLKVRSLGSSALEIAMVGLGRGLAFIDLRGKLRNVDVAAALGIARECGAATLNSRGNELSGDIDKVSVVGDVIVARKERAGDIIRAISESP